MFFFFFQAEDGIRDRTVTGVQTCALPIYRARPGAGPIVAVDPAVQRFAKDVEVLVHALAPGPAVDAAADAHVANQSIGSAEEFSARVLERTVEQRETRVARESDARRGRVGRLRLDVQLVVRERAI